MLQRGKDSPLTTHGFLVSAELVEDQATPEQASLKLADSLSWVEGIGHVDVTHLGTIDMYPEKEV